MIEKLMAAIVALLRAELTGFAEPESRIVAGNSALDGAGIFVYPGALLFEKQQTEPQLAEFLGENGGASVFRPASEREFEQEFLVGIQESDPLVCEKWASLTLGLLAIETGGLIEGFNRELLQYKTAGYSTTHRISSIFIGGVFRVGPPEQAGVRIDCKARGRLFFRGERSAEFGVIEKVHGPGTRENGALEIKLR